MFLLFLTINTKINSSDAKIFTYIDDETMLENSSVEVIMKLSVDCCNLSLEVDALTRSDEIDELLHNYREELKKHYVSKNFELLEEIECFNFSSYYISCYTPFVFIYFDSYSEYEENYDKLLGIANYSFVEYINVCTYNSNDLAYVASTAAGIILFQMLKMMLA